MGILNWGNGDNPIPAMVTLKKLYSLLVLNTDTGEPEALEVSQLLTPFSTDDLQSGTTTKQYTNAAKLKVDNLPNNTNESISSLESRMTDLEMYSIIF